MKNEETRLSNQISLIQFIQQVAVSHIGHALIDKIVDTTWPSFIIPKQFPKAYHDYFDQRIYRAANALLKYRNLRECCDLHKNKIKKNTSHKGILIHRDIVLKRVPEELLPEPEGILMGGGRCFTPLPKTDVWTSGEIPSPCMMQ